MLGATLYRCLLCLYPPAFRRDFAEELESDFEDGRREARAAGAAAVAVWWLRLLGDFAFSFCREWLRTPRLAASLLAAGLTFVLFSFTAFKVRQWPHYPVWPPPHGVDPNADDLGLIVVMTVGVLIPIAGTILGSMWMLLFRRSTARRRRRDV